MFNVKVLVGAAVASVHEVRAAWRGDRFWSDGGKGAPMIRPDRALALGLAVIALVTSPAARADTIINFDDLALPNLGAIPADYGSRVGDTPNIAVSYRTFDPVSDHTVASNLDLWNAGYGDLSKVAIHVLNNEAGEIIFAPDPGFLVTLISFDMAGYPTIDRGEEFVHLVDASGNLLLTIGDGTIIEGDNGHSSFAPNFTWAGTVRLQFGRDWNVGIDNIRLSQASVPEPTSLALLSLGGAGLGLAIRRRATRGWCQVVGPRSASPA